ncbi:MAG: TolC family protein [Bdellovibrionales bacterium]|jgi:outer membrane protein, heavy metal efflux system|nr:TolC family protein [Bdellovibrionales bacterium]
MKTFILLILISCDVFAFTFKDSIKKLDNHNKVLEITNRAKASLEEGREKGSWGDPKLKILAKNFPIKNLKYDQSGMTGVEIWVSQNIPLSSKYKKREEIYRSSSNAYILDSQDMKNFLAKELWMYLIINREIKEKKQILKENLKWIIENIQVSRKLYSNGKISQQAILELEIRKSELEVRISNKRFELDQVSENVFYLLGYKIDAIDQSTIPWNILNKENLNIKDHRELALQKRITVQDLKIKESKLGLIPDLSLSISATKRAANDGAGDFVGAGVSFSLPLSSQKYGRIHKNIYQKYSLSKKFEEYKRKKTKERLNFESDLLKLKQELNIVETKSLVFAKSSMNITSKSYGLGRSTYVELLQSELTLQKLLLRQSSLKSRIDLKKIDLRYLLGGKMYE